MAPEDNQLSLNFSENSQFSVFHWIIDKERNFAACIVPKAASTSFQKMYMAINQREIAYLIRNKVTRHEYNPEFSEKDVTRKPERFHDNEKYGGFLADGDSQLNNIVYKILLTRHPFERLYSGFKDKFDFTKPNVIEAFKPTSDLIKNSNIYNFRSAKLEPIPIGFDINFHSFLNYIASTTSEENNAHFRPTSSICPICYKNLKYDYIVKQESLNEDMLLAFKLGMVNSNKSLKFNSSKRVEDERFISKIVSVSEKDTNHEMFNTYHASSSAKDVFRNIFRKNVTLLNLLYRKFYLDFIYFNYTLVDYVDNP